MRYSYDRRVAVLVQRDHDGKKEWALKEKDGPKILKWFGPEKPSEEAVAKEERRIQFFKHR